MNGNELGKNKKKLKNWDKRILIDLGVGVKAFRLKNWSMLKMEIGRRYMVRGTGRNGR